MRKYVLIFVSTVIATRLIEFALEGFIGASPPKWGLPVLFIAALMLIIFAFSLSESEEPPLPMWASFVLVIIALGLIIFVFLFSESKEPPIVSSPTPVHPSTFDLYKSDFVEFKYPPGWLLQPEEELGNISGIIEAYSISLTSTQGSKQEEDKTGSRGAIVYLIVGNAIVDGATICDKNFIDEKAPYKEMILEAVAVLHDDLNYGSKSFASETVNINGQDAIYIPISATTPQGVPIEIKSYFTCNDLHTLIIIETVTGGIYEDIYFETTEEISKSINFK